MLKQISSSRLLIGALAVCVLIVSGSLLYYRDTKIDADRAKAETEARIKAHSERMKQQAETAAAAAAAQKADTAQQGGHFHADGTYHAGPHTEHAPTTPQQRQGTTPVASSHKEKFLAEYRAKYGEDPPPPGANWTHGFDTNGKPFRAYEGEAAIVGIETEIGFAPTKAQYERFKQLQADLRVATWAGDQNKANAITAEMEQLVEDSQGEVPINFQTIYVGFPGEDRETGRKNARIARRKARLKVMQQFGLAHLIEDERR